MALVVLSAVVHDESSKAGEASGASERVFHPVSVGSLAACGPGATPVSDPEAETEPRSGVPLTLTEPALAKPSRPVLAAVSARRSTEPPEAVAERSTEVDVPYSSTGPADDEAVQNLAASASVPSRSSSGRRPPPVISTRAR